MIKDSFTTTAARLAYDVQGGDIGAFFRDLETSSIYQAIACGAGASSWAPLTDSLQSGNNLNDIEDAADARANIGANRCAFVVQCGNLVGATRYGFVAPFAFTIDQIDSVLLGHALATGNCTLTAKIGGVAVTGGAITITQSGSAIGDKDACAPSAANVVAEGDFVELLVGGTNSDTAAFAVATVSGTY